MLANGDEVKLLGGRQDAYRARTRASLLNSAQEVMAEIGLGATIDDIAIQARVSPATIYNHFHSKEEYLQEALVQIWNEWLTWAYDGKSAVGDLDTMLEVCRKMLRIDRDHTLIGRVLGKTLKDAPWSNIAL